MDWKDAMLGLLDRLGAESWPFVDNSPEEVQDAVWDHVRWLEQRAADEARFNGAKTLLEAGSEEMRARVKLEAH